MRLGLFVITFLLTSCDYFLNQKVIVVDKKTTKAIPNVEVSIRTLKLMTDSTGFCHFHKVTGNMNKRTIKTRKEGYKDFEIAVDVSGDFVVYKQKIDANYEPMNSFAVMKDTLIVYLEKK